MPRQSRKKQARLAFAPASADTSTGVNNESDNQSDRQARLSYGHPSMAAVRSGGSRIGGSEPSKRRKTVQQYLEVQVETPKKAKEPGNLIFTSSFSFKPCPD